MYTCNYCDSKIEKMIPYRGGAEDQSEFIKQAEVIGSDLDNFGCPVCGSTDRERHLKQYLEKIGILKNKGMRILHFAPEFKFVNFIKNLNPEIHVFADLHPTNPSVKSIDICDIPYGDETFDLIIANHILEHVADCRLALSEINRVLKKDGFAIIQTPYSSKFQKTFEDPGINSAVDRSYYYGQEDHVRLFGNEIFDLYSEYLVSSVFRHEDVFDLNFNEFSVNFKEPLFLFRKKINSNFSLNLQGAENLVGPANDASPSVSVCCLTYKHEEYLERALDSFLMQKTNFNFEIIVADDASGDATSEIVNHYNNKCGNTIRFMRRDVNVGMHANLASALSMCRGDYIAFCDGDDYWTDCEKIQKQYNFLVANPEFSVSYGSVQAIRNGKIDYSYRGGLERDCSQLELICMPAINTLTAMFKNVFKTMPVEYYLSGSPDLFLWGYLGCFGGGKFMAEITPSIYNMHEGGIHSLKGDADKINMYLMSVYALYLLHKRLGHVDFSDYFSNNFRTVLDRACKVYGASFGDQLFDNLKSRAQRNLVTLDEL